MARRSCVAALFVTAWLSGLSARGSDAGGVGHADPVPAAIDPELRPFDDPGEICHDPCTHCCDDGCDCLWGENESIWDNLSVFMGLEGSKQPADFGVNAHFGGRFHANMGIPLVRPWGLGLQVGTAINATGNAVQVVERIEGTSGRTQSFTTIGLFQRAEWGPKWGLAYDFLYEEGYDQFNLGQWRGLIGYEFSERNEFGLRGSLSERDDEGTFGPIPVVLDPITQGSVYWRHTWATSASTMLWMGVAEGHSEANVALGDFPDQDNPFLFGAELYVPLNDYVGVYGEGNFIMPADTGTVDSYLGFVFYPGGGARSVYRRRFAPVLPLGNNTSFAVDMARR